MSKLEKLLRLSLIDTHVAKAADFVRRSDLAITPSLRIVLLQHAEEHLEDATRLRNELQEMAS